MSSKYCLRFMITLLSNKKNLFYAFVSFVVVLIFWIRFCLFLGYMFYVIFSSTVDIFSLVQLNIFSWVIRTSWISQMPVKNAVATSDKCMKPKLRRERIWIKEFGYFFFFKVSCVLLLIVFIYFIYLFINKIILSIYIKLYSLSFFHFFQ